MNTGISQEVLGRRIMKLRKQKGLSQADVARSLEISRPSLAQIELGNRSIDALELHSISLILGFSLDEFMSAEFSVPDLPELKKKEKKQKSEERVAAPLFQASKFRNLLLYILEKCAGKPNVGETVLHKLLYFCDFNYYEQSEEHLTGATYRKLPYGPVPQKMDAIINQMIHAQQLQRIKTEYHGLQQTRYLPLTKADLTEFMASEKGVLDKVIEQMSDWSAAAISSYSLKDMPCLATKDGEEIHYELAFYREAPFSVRNDAEVPDAHEL